MSRLVSVIAIVAAIAFAVPAVRHWRERPPAPVPPAQPLRSALLPPGGLDAGAGAEYPFGLSLASDGRTLVYPAAKAGVVTLYLHDLRTGEARALPGTDGAAMPFWSADRSRVGFFAGGHLRALDLASGQATDLADAASGRGAAWNAAGDVVFAPLAPSGVEGSAGGLMHRDAAGKVAPFTTLDAATGETSHAWPAFLPDGRHVVFLVTASQSSRSGIWIAPLDDPASRKKLFDADAQAVVALPQASPPQVPGPKPQAPTILYLRDLALMAQSLDPASLEPAGRAEVVGLNAGRGPLGQIFVTASSDVLIYGAPGTTLRELRWLTRAGQPAGSTSEPLDAWDLRIAPDGRRFIVTEVDRQLRTLDVFIRTAAQPAPTRLSRSTDGDESGVWSPDGLRVAWAGQRRKVLIRGAGAVLPEQTIATFDTRVQVWDWSRDGRSLLIGRRHNDTGEDLWLQPPVEGAPAQPYATAPFDQTFGAFSPDGRAIAYASNESGQFDIYVDAFPKPGSRMRVTTAGGTEPRWSNDGRELYFRRGSEIISVLLDGLEVRSITRLFDAGAPIRSYDVSRDGRFLINVPSGSDSSPAMTLIQNWLPRN
jgi:Tol biopolymer transport system component